MSLMRENPFREPLKGAGPENRDFFVPEMATSEASAIWAPKSRAFQGPPLLMVWVMDFPASKLLSPSVIEKNRYISNFMYTNFCILYSVFCVLYSVLLWCEFACMSIAAAVCR